jgi:hypothetical protein
MRQNGCDGFIDENCIATKCVYEPSARHPVYEAPVLYTIGGSRELLRGSGRHKNDDTGGRGFVVG